MILVKLKSMKERISEFILFKNLTPAEFADAIGVQRSSVSHVLNGRNNPSFSFIQKMMESFPEINSRWLMLGEGSILGQVRNTEIENDEQEEEKVPDLFSTTSDNIEQQIKNKPADLSKKTQKKDLVEKAVKQIKNSPSIPNTKTVKKVLIFYSDHTFEEYSPTD